MQIFKQSFEYNVKVSDYFQLTKPRIVVLLAITGMVAYLLPSVGAVSGVDVIIYLILGYLSAGGAMAVNNAIDYDIDAVMERTKSRVSTGVLSRQHVVIFGGTLLVSGIILAFFYFGPYTALYLAWGGLFYIFAYSLYLKRSSWLNTIIGGLASPAPVWGGYAARYEIAGISSPNLILGVPIEGWLLGMLVFIWTPTHTFAMVVKNLDDYERANIPMLPVLIGINKTSKVVAVGGLITILYAIGFAIIYNQPAVIPLLLISTIFGFYLIRFLLQPTIKEGTRNFHAHNIWLGLVFVLLIFGGN